MLFKKHSVAFDVNSHFFPFILFYVNLAQLILLLLVGVMKEENIVKINSVSVFRWFYFQIHGTNIAAPESFKIKMCLLSFSSETCAENGTNTDRQKKCHCQVNAIALILVTCYKNINQINIVYLHPPVQLV